MAAFYPLLTLISIVVFVWLARSLARSRNRSVIGWGLVGAILPPALIVLYLMKPLAPDEDDGDEETAEA